MMRGCRGSDPGKSADAYQVSQKVGRSGRRPDEWAAFGIGVGKMMRRLLNKGLCQEKCKHFGIQQLSNGPLCEFEATWGKGSYAKFIKDKKPECTLTPEEWYDNCPNKGREGL